MRSSFEQPCYKLFEEKTGKAWLLKRKGKAKKRLRESNTGWVRRDTILGRTVQMIFQVHLNARHAFSPACQPFLTLLRTHPSHSSISHGSTLSTLSYFIPNITTPPVEISSRAWYRVGLRVKIGSYTSPHAPDTLSLPTFFQISILSLWPSWTQSPTPLILPVQESEEVHCLQTWSVITVMSY